MKERFDVSGMTCASCQANVQKAVEKLGVDFVNVNLISETMTVSYDDGKISENDIIKTVEKIGYGAKPKNKKNLKENNKTFDEEKNCQKQINYFFYIFDSTYVCFYGTHDKSSTSSFFNGSSWQCKFCFFAIFINLANSFCK